MRNTHSRSGAKGAKPLRSCRADAPLCRMLARDGSASLQTRAREASMHSARIAQAASVGQPMGMRAQPALERMAPPPATSRTLRLVGSVLRAMVNMPVSHIEAAARHKRPARVSRLLFATMPTPRQMTPAVMAIEAPAVSTRALRRAGRRRATTAKRTKAPALARVAISRPMAKKSAMLA